MHDVVIVGGGFAGQVVAAELRSAGLDVLVVDDGRPLGGSRAAAGLMKPSWLAGWGRPKMDEAFALLDRHFGVRDLEVRTGPLKLGGVKWCDPARVLAGPTLRATAQSAEAHAVTLADGSELLARRAVVVAAGAWSAALVPGLAVEARHGLACLWPGEEIGEPFMRLWAPYRHLVGITLAAGAWVGDGSAVRERGWTPARQAASVERCVGAVDPIWAPPTVLHGLRPYLQGGSIAAPIGHGPWVVTGGGKVGLPTAAWAATYLRSRLC